MQLLTKTLERRFAEVGSQKNNPDPIVIVRFFDQMGTNAWYMTEYDPKNRWFFGVVDLHKKEFFDFSLKKLQYANKWLGYRIVRDLNFTERPLSEVQ